MRDRKQIEDMLREIHKGIAVSPLRGVVNAPIVLQALTVELLLDMRDLLSQVETSTDRIDARVHEGLGTSRR